MTRQTSLVFRTWGGARKGAGRKPTGVKPGAPHGRRPKVDARVPLHLTMRVAGVPSLRSQQCIKVMRTAFSGGKDRYVGSIDKYGLDLGFTGSSYIVWTVLAPSTDIPSGALQGNYGGVSAEATVGLGVGANALLGGSENSIALQPVSVQAQQGLNVAVGVSALSLRFDGHY